MKILFSCFATSDPIRGFHDGPMLHILRRYRPDVVYIFLTAEMEKKDDSDYRIERTKFWVENYWDYTPQWRVVRSGVVEAHKIDVLDKPMHDAVAQAVREHPDAELLLNLTSGTPQMQIILAQVAMDSRYHAKGIQVNNFEEKSGTTQRTNADDYDLLVQFMYNQDEAPGVDPRCTEPEMITIQRENARHQIFALLEEYDFDAVEKMADALPESLRPLICHLAARNRLDNERARQLAKEIKKTPCELYPPYKSVNRKEPGRYTELCEYYLMMRNLAKAGHYTEFLLHMEPLVLNLQVALLKNLLKAENVNMGNFILYEGRNGQQEQKRWVFDPDVLWKVYRPLYDYYDEKFVQKRGWAPQKTDLSTYLCGGLLQYFKQPPHCQALFKRYSHLKTLRNELAHTLRACTAEDIQAACRVAPEALLAEMEGAIVECYPACDPSIFTVYDRCIAFLMDKDEPWW